MFFGEFVDDEKEKNTPKGAVGVPLEGEKEENDENSKMEVFPVFDPDKAERRNICGYLAIDRDVELISQQRGEPELTHKQRTDIALEILNKSQSQFMYRFGQHLLHTDLNYFDKHAEKDPTLRHYLKLTRDRIDKKKAKTRIRNRRFALIKMLEKEEKLAANFNKGGGSSNEQIKKHKDYFSEKEMKRRNPLVYNDVLGRYLSPAEVELTDRIQKERGRSLSALIYEKIDDAELRELKKRQEEQEDDMFEECDEDEEEDCEDSMSMYDVMDHDELPPAEKALRKQEFLTSMHSDFVTGKDDTFNYKEIDFNEDYDLLDIEGEDREAEYFDEEEPCFVGSEDNTSRSSSPLMPPLPRPKATNDSKTAASFKPIPLLPHAQDQDMPLVESLTLTE